ncbi:MAG: hypothetical protein EA363_13625 [Balneolaceae bacterium]|nr:MAG: hypothetical protein EA363_13625 [Balneolaceae bacterium]
MFHPCSASTILIGTALFVGAVLSGCSHTSELPREDVLDETADVDYSVIYYIHADSDYLYHDNSGRPVLGNRRVLDKARNVAENAESGEVFIFYQRPERRILGLFPRRSSRFYHYVKGELASRVNYRHSDSSEEFLTTEARLHNRYGTRSGKENQRKFFLFYGHEIPDDGGKNYHRTKPDIAVNTGSFSTGVQRFLMRDEQQYDLIVLSTCNNGTPVMADRLISFSNVLLASPQNLHLSHIDSESLDLLESEPGISAVQLARSMADQTYKRLASEIQTTITLTVYDFEVVRNFNDELHAFAMAYDSLGSRHSFSENIDCKQVPFFDDDTFSKGIKTWYRPARFGRQSHTDGHSGWGCKPLMENGRDR